MKVPLGRPYTQGGRQGEGGGRRKGVSVGHADTDQHPRVRRNKHARMYIGEELEMYEVKRKTGEY